MGAALSRQEIQPVWSARDSLLLLALLGFATLLRAAFYTGFFGSDEMLYIKAALYAAEGAWIPPGDYIGDQRYGINLPMAFFLRLFGRSEMAAAAWSFLCSLLEVALVYVAGRALWGRRAAIIAALLLASLPIHVHMAGRLMADAPLTGFMTLAFVLFLFAERRSSALLYLLAGLAAGFVFWIKEVTIIFLVLFLPLALLYRPWNWQRLLFPAGVTLLLVANSMLMWVVNGDPLHVFKMVHGRVNEVYLGSREFRSEPGYYFHYLFLKIQHTGLVGYFALAGGILWGWRWRRTEPETAYAVIWAGGMLLLFSLFIVSLSPLTFIAKQSNYLTLFAAPLCLLAGYFLSWLRGLPMIALGTFGIATGIALSALEQAAVQVATANDRGSVLFAAENPGISVYGPMRAEKAWAYQARLSLNWSTPVVRHYEGMSSADIHAYPAYAVWEEGNSDRYHAGQPPYCWQARGTLEPAPPGLGGRFAAWLLDTAKRLPGSLGISLAGRLSTLVEPNKATLYEIPPDCSFSIT